MIVEAPKRVERLLEKSGRITPRQVLQAYEETGLEPTVGFLRKPGERACAVGALMSRDGFPFDDENPPGRIAFRDRYGGRAYITSFERGFDGVNLTGCWIKGWRDGRRARRFVESRYGTFS